MKTVKLNVYQFDELSKAAKQVAIDNYRDINTDHDWWEWTYEDAANVGIEITGFDLGRGQDIDGKLTENLRDVCESIIAEHGDTCSTHKTAQKYYKQYKVLAVTLKLLGDENDDAYMETADKMEDLEEEFKEAILKDYFKMLEDEYEYLQSDEAIIDTINANEYEYYKDGTRYSTRRKTA